MDRLTLKPLNDQVCQVLDARDGWVGNLKLINGVWKFKAIGFDAQGNVLPGGGPLTARHNALFTQLDEAEVSARLLAPLVTPA